MPDEPEAQGLLALLLLLHARSADWRAILTLYDQLYALTPTPVVALNRAVARAEVRGPAAGLAAVDDLRSPALDSYYLFHAARRAQPIKSRTRLNAPSPCRMFPGRRFFLPGMQRGRC
jgi:predicted RNA polymerase sigma factor